MRAHYDFSKGVRGKFHRPDAVFRLPVYLDEKVESYLAAKADAKGIELSELVKASIGPAGNGQAACKRRPP